MITISIILVIFCIALLAYLILHSRVPKVKDQYIGWTPVFIMKDGSPLVKIFYIKSRVNDRTIIGNMADMEGEWRAVI